MAYAKNDPYWKEYYQKNKEKIKQRSANWRKQNPDRAKAAVVEWHKSNKEAVAKYRAQLKFVVYRAYGNRCVCCGEDNPEFLSIDHINGGGSQMRANKTHPVSGVALYYWIIKNKFPKMFRLLCHNCNMATRFDMPCHHKEDMYSKFETSNMFSVFQLPGV